MPSDKIIPRENPFGSLSSEGTEKNLCYVDKQRFVWAFVAYTVTTNIVSLFQFILEKKKKKGFFGRLFFYYDWVTFACAITTTVFVS